ncbi:extensin, partial [Streptomyces sp. JAC25]
RVRTGGAAPPPTTPAPAPARVTSPPRATSVAVQRSSSGSSAADKPAPSVTSQLKPRDLKEDQVAELVHRLIGPMTRMLRAELRLDRERIGKLRDPRH